MKYVTIEEFELLSFFEVQPEVLDANPWPYNSFTYRVALSDYSIEFSLDPAYKSVSLTIAHFDTVVHRFDASLIDDVRYLKSEDSEIIEVVVSDHQSLMLQIRPTVLVKQWVTNRS